MSILGEFISSDVRHDPLTWIDWVLDDSQGFIVEGNITELEKKGDFINLTSLYDYQDTPTILQLPRNQLIQILNDWDEKVCKKHPKVVTITFENGEYVIETKE